jgi:transcription initiation factor TFIID subunit 1
VGLQQQMKEQNDAANKIYRHMRRLADKGRIRSTATGGTGDSSDDDGDDMDDDGDDSSDESDESDDSLADELEQGMDKDKNAPLDEDEERRELEEMKKMMRDGEEAGAGGEGGEGGDAAGGQDEGKDPAVGDPSGAGAGGGPVGPTRAPPGKRLVLRRIVTKTYLPSDKYPNGFVEDIADDVSADVGDAWMKARR